MQFLRNAWLPRRAQKCPRLQPDSFWDEPTNFSFIPPLFPTGLAWGALGSSEMPQTAARAIFEHDTTDFHSFIPPPCFRLVRPEGPGEPRRAPDCSQSRFGTIRRIFPSASVRLVRGSECLAFVTNAQNYFETILFIYSVSHP